MSTYNQRAAAEMFCLHVWHASTMQTSGQRRRILTLCRVARSPLRALLRSGFMARFALSITASQTCSSAKEKKKRERGKTSILSARHRVRNLWKAEIRLQKVEDGFKLEHFDEVVHNAEGQCCPPKQYIPYFGSPWNQSCTSRSKK